MPGKIGVPSVRGVGDAAADFGYGIAGGLVYQVVTRYSGSSLLGAAVGAAVAGAVVKGNRGEIIAVNLGMQAAGDDLIQNAIAGIPGIGR